MPAENSSQGDWDPRSVRDISFSIWAQLNCECAKCGLVEDLPQTELIETDPIAWSEIVGPILYSKGWAAPHEFCLICPGCVQAGADISRAAN